MSRYGRLYFVFTAILSLFACESYDEEGNRSFSSINDMHDKRVAVQMGTNHDQFLSNCLPNAEILRVENNSDLLPMLLGNKVDGIVDDGEFIKHLHKKKPDILIIDSTFYYEDFGFCFSSASLRDEFNSFLSDLKTTGELGSILKKWNTDCETALMPDFANNGVNGTINVGYLDYMPCSFIRNNELCGHDVEIVLRFGSSVGKKVEFFNIVPAGMITAVATGKIDIMCGRVTITDEPKKSVLFSDVYDRSPAALAVRARDAACSVGGDSPSANLTFWRKVSQGFHNNLVKEDRWKLVVSGLEVTLLISLWSILLGTVLGGVICYLRMSRNRTLSVFAKTYIELLRGIPQVVLLMLMFYVVFASSGLTSVAVAVITFSMNFSAYVSEMFRTSIESINRGQTEAGVSLGFNKVETFVFIVAPQALRRVFPIYKGELIALVKMTSIVGYIAVQDLTKAGDIIRSRTFDAFFPLIFIAVLYFIVSWSLTYLLSLIGKKYERDN